MNSPVENNANPNQMLEKFFGNDQAWRIIFFENIDYQLISYQIS